MTLYTVLSNRRVLTAQVESFHAQDSAGAKAEVKLTSGETIVAQIEATGGRLQRA